MTTVCGAEVNRQAVDVAPIFVDYLIIIVNHIFLGGSLTGRFGEVFFVCVRKDFGGAPYWRERYIDIGILNHRLAGEPIVLPQKTTRLRFVGANASIPSLISTIHS